jgi:alpha-D-ribose 1-methylphosphonate 5-phosphate C-P lyase
LGSVHPSGRCAYCGYGGDREWLEKVVIAETHAWGWRCENTTVCLRRRQEQSQMRLFGA